jgi:RND family efflux transporter MFP subunit
MKNHIIPFLAALLVLASCGPGKQPISAADAQPIRVEVLEVRRAEVARLCEAPGTVVNRDLAMVASRVAGTVAEADFAIGQDVSAGQILVVFSTPEMEARVEQALAAVARAKRDYERESALLEGGASTGQTVSELAERLRMAEASLAEARAYASYARVAAPFDGRILQKLVRAGDFAAPGTPLFEVAGRRGLRIESYIPDSFPDQPIGTSIAIQAEGIDCAGILAEASPSADPMSRTRHVKLDVSCDSGLRSGQFVRIFWPVGTREDYFIPASCVTQYGQIQRVITVQDGVSRMRIVRTGERMGDDIQVLSGIEEGDLVVVGAPASLVSGSRVEVVR